MTKSRATLLATALAAALSLGTIAVADPNPQLVNSIEIRLAHYGLHADVSQFATSTVARLHLTLSQRESYWKKRRELIWILQNAKNK